MAMAPQTIPLEEYGENGYLSYRIPGITVTAAETLLCYYEMRLRAHDDWSTRAIGLRRSTDGGRTWSARTAIAADDALAVGNPVMIASKDGRVHFLWLKDMRRPFYQVSLDDGKTFSPPVSLLACMQGYREKIDWSLFAFGPGHGIELSGGRLLVPIWLCTGEGNNHYPTCVSTLYSDDGGAVWERGEVIQGQPQPDGAFVNPNETQAAELTDGSVLLNMRHAGRDHCRYLSISPDGAAGFCSPRPDPRLPDPLCFGSILRSLDELLFVNCAHRDDRPPEEGKRLRLGDRVHLTVRLSRDDARTWPHAREIAPVAGYADIAASPDGKTVYCFFEQDWVPGCGMEPQRLAFCRFSREWLCAGDAGGARSCGGHTA